MITPDEAARAEPDVSRGRGQGMGHVQLREVEPAARTISSRFPVLPHVGANAGQIWQLTFESADLGGSFGPFPSVPGDSSYFRQGTGQHTPVGHKHR